MLRSSLNKVVPILLVTYLVSYLGLFLFCLIFPPPDLLPYFRLDTAAKSGLDLFIEYLIPIHATGVLIAYSLFVEFAAIGIGKRSGIHRIVTSVIIFFIIISMIYAAIIIWVQPAVITGINENRSKSMLSQRYYEQAEQATIDADKATGDERERLYRSAFLYIDSSLSINPEYKPAQELERKIRRVISNEEIPLTESGHHEKAEQEDQGKARIEGLDADGLMENANRMYAKEDYYSAYYYASMAFRLDNTRVDAKNMIVTSMEKIKSYDLSGEDERIRSLYLKKQEGYEKLASGEFISAYYLFKELHEEYPADQDASDYLAKIEGEFLDKLAFFYEELEHLDLLVGVRDILFSNQIDETEAEYVSVEKMVRVDEGIYFFNTEVMRVSPSGTILSHYLAPYGKYMFVDTSMLSGGKEKKRSSHHINFNCIYKNSPVRGSGLRQGTDLLPVYFIQSKKEGNELKNILPLSPDISLFKNFRSTPDNLRETGLLELLSIAFNREYEKAGYSIKTVDAEIVTRCMLPFLFIVFSLFAIALGWACRSRYEDRPSLFTMIFIPVFPIVVTLFIRFFMTGMMTLFDFFTLIFPLLVSLAVCIAIQFIFIFAGLIVIAGKLTD
ncbi:MAG: hypothetical protein JW881_05930 [Spirochaetales bacterium]|nr:hypothetical protein [Spirochaetales bacterium]